MRAAADAKLAVDEDKATAVQAKVVEEEHKTSDDTGGDAAGDSEATAELEALHAATQQALERIEAEVGRKRADAERKRAEEAAVAERKRAEEAEAQLQAQLDAQLQAAEAAEQQRAAEAEERLCVICMTLEKNATIVHGESGHVCCCYGCAKMLRARGETCPICREPIDQVIRQFAS